MAPDPSPLRWLRLLSWAGVLSMLAAAAIGIPVAILLGPYLAMGLAIWTMRTTDPRLPDLPYPWWALALCVAGVAAGAALRRRGGGWPGLALATVAATAAALLPFVHILRLLGRT